MLHFFGDVCRIEFLVSRACAERLQKLAKEQGITVGQLLRKLVNAP